MISRSLKKPIRKVAEAVEIATSVVMPLTTSVAKFGESGI